MAKIREDLVGAVHVDGRVLFAGDAVPAGVKVGDHLLVSENPKPAEPVEKPKPKRGRPPKSAPKE